MRALNLSQQGGFTLTAIESGFGVGPERPKGHCLLGDFASVAFSRSSRGGKGQWKVANELSGKERTFFGLGSQLPWYWAG